MPVDFIHGLGMFALGSSAWLGIVFLGRRIREFFSLRREIRHFVLLYWDGIDAGQLIDPERAAAWQEKIVAIRTALSDLGTRLGAFEKEKPFATWVISKMGFNLTKAGWDLRNFGIVLGTGDQDCDGSLFKKMDAALKLRINPNQRRLQGAHGVER
jgi:hypothetical protein